MYIYKYLCMYVYMCMYVCLCTYTYTLTERDNFIHRYSYIIYMCICLNVIDNLILNKNEIIYLSKYYFIVII